MENVAFKVAAWIESLPNHRNVRPVTLTIGKETFHGAEYDSVGHYEAGMMACTHRGAVPGTEYLSRRTYFVGDLPKPYKRRRATCFVVAGDAREWYLGGYADDRCLQAPFKEFHPFGRTFMLFPWDVAGKVDDGEDRTYTRVNAAINPAVKES